MVFMILKLSILEWGDEIIFNFDTKISKVYCPEVEEKNNLTLQSNPAYKETYKINKGSFNKNKKRSLLVQTLEVDSNTCCACIK